MSRLKQGEGRFGRTADVVRAAKGLHVTTWRMIGDAGEESEAVGAVWGPAPAWNGSRALWVRTLLAPPPETDPTLADLMIDEEDFGPTVMVARAHKRRVAELAGRGGVALPGRWIERGEYWNDWGMRHAVASAVASPAPTRIRGVRTLVDEVMERAWQENPAWVLVQERQLTAQERARLVGR